MFRRSSERETEAAEFRERVDSVLGAGITWQGQISGTGGIRIEGAFDGEIALRGMVVIGPQGRVTCKQMRAAIVIVAGSVKGDITAQKVEIASTGRVWGDVITASFSTEEGAFLRGQIRMEEKVDLGLGVLPGEEDDADPAQEAQAPQSEGADEE